MRSRALQILLLLLIPSIRAALKNVTIDDTNGDPNTGAKPTYLPDIWQHPDCSGCAIKPPLDDVFMKTYSALTYMQEKFPSMSIQFSFHGTAIWVFFILANSVGDGISTETLCNFTLDGNFIITFHHNPTTSPNYNFNYPVFSLENLPNKSHTLLISTSGLDRHVFTSFDYAIYQFDDGIGTTTSQPTPTTITDRSAATITQATTATGIDSSTPITTAISTTVTQFEPSSSSSDTISFSSPISSSSSSPNATITGITGIPRTKTLESTGTQGSTRSVLATSSWSGDTSVPQSSITANNITSHKAPTGAVAGGVVGGVLLILILVLFTLLRRRRRTHGMGLPTTIQEREPHHPVLTPFTASSPANPTETRGQPFASIRVQQDVPQMHKSQGHHSPSASATSAETVAIQDQSMIGEQSNSRKGELDAFGSSARGSSRSGRSGVTQLMQQNEAMKAEIERLQASLGLIDGAPPEYSAHVADIHRLASGAIPVTIS